MNYLREGTRMKGKVLKGTSLLLASVMLVGSLAACSSKEEDKKTTDDTGKANTTENTTETPAADKSPITYTMLAADPSPDWNQMQDEVGKTITEKTGVTLKMDFATDANKVAL